MAADNAFVLVEHENGIIAPVARVHAETSGAKIVEGDAVDLRGRPVRPVRANGRPVKPRVNLDPLASATGYSAMTGKQLKAEIQTRNASRDNDAQLSATGNKAALLAVLESDDQATALAAADGEQAAGDPADPETSDADASEEAVTPTEGAADSTLTNPKE